MGQSLVSIQNSLSAGELSPSLYGRTDLSKWHSGTSTCRNFFVDYRGGVCSRAGLAYVGTCKQQYPIPPRDIPFQFSIEQGYVLEFGQLYMRIKANGAYVTEATVAVNNVSSTAVFTTTAPHGYSIGDWVYDLGNTGFAGLTWIINATTSNEFTVTDLFGNHITSATPSTGGTVARIYTVVSPYNAIDLPYLKYTQSADVMTLTCVNTSTSTEYPPYSLSRNGATNWTFTEDSFSAVIATPTGLTGTAYSSAQYSTWYSYVVTAVDATTGEESNPSVPFNIQNNDISIYAGSNNLTWTAVQNANSYNVYAAVPSYGAQISAGNLYGYIGTSLGPNFVDTNITPDFTQVPPQHANPFARGAILDVIPSAGGSNYSQSTVGYTVTTSTGTGFSGTPVVADSSLAGFIIGNGGSGYEAGDSITITDSGGGLATGNFTFSGQPSVNQLINFNGVNIGWSSNNDPTPTPYQSNVGSTLALSLQNLAQVLNALDNVSINCASYVATATELIVTYKTPGTVGNAYTLNANTTSNATASGTTLAGGGVDGSGATVTLTIGPESGTYPSTCAYYQQRRVYASSLNDPDTYWMSQPGLFTNMDSSIPVTDADAITGTPWAQQVNGIQFPVPMPGGLVILTGKGAWQLNGGSSAALTPADQDATPQAYNGCNAIVPPLTINYDILYVQAKGSIVRDLSYNFFVNIYTGTDLTVLSNHLFIFNQLLQWCWAEEPFKLVWALRNDGVLLSLTYLKEQEVYSWARHDTNGQFVSVCSVTEPPVDAVYVIVARYVQGQYRYYSERMNNRIWNNVEESFCVDAGLSYPQTFPNGSLYVTAATGANVEAASSVSCFNSGMIGDVIRTGGGKMTITSYINPFGVFGEITQPITATTPNDPNNLPLPQPSGSWSISTPTSTVSGLNHLEGMEVAILADGSVVPNTIVANNSVSLPQPASNIVVGLPYTCQVQTLYIDHPGEITVQNRRKSINAIGVRCEQTRGLQLGADQIDASTQQNYATVPWENMNEIKERNMFVNAGSAVPLYTGDHYKLVTSGWDVRGQLAVQQVYPLPATILALTAFWTVGDDR